jgi:hypothetical protein
MAGLPYVRQHQALRHVGQPHRPAAGHSEGGTDRSLPPQAAAGRNAENPNKRMKWNIVQAEIQVTQP